MFNQLLHLIALEYAYQGRMRAHGGNGAGATYKTSRREFLKLKWVQKAPWLQLGGPAPYAFQER